ncbi:Gmad2 immunoglobulin-like domain-containing protein [Alkaliphilus peptidifermentans]|uniref:PrcB C-terminal n=1 Tax=Alkaliphilus peptidifermentans DSM 18978 TaxID=1120976 RepID=A0A1G5KHD1_9FIRM|nr:Gmad2 immunoglobulin-like domain-containing protein [Alkaliphilus peptidifermentans]SCY99977.1 PrcB C-terminal [Alkaliphilus peptidifermentans DSM 18978]
MGKYKLLISLVIMVLVLFGCQREEAPNPPAEDVEEVQYPYEELQHQDIAFVEFFWQQEKTLPIEDEEVLKNTAQHIREVEFVGKASPQDIEDTTQGMTVYLNRELEESQMITMYFNEDQENLFTIGPNGEEYKIRSQRLLNFIRQQMDQRLVILDEDAIPQEAQEWFDKFRNEIGAYVYQHPDGTLILINAGEKPTGGYGIKVVNYNEEDYPRTLTIDIVEPEEGTVVTQAITYPSIIVKIFTQEASKYEVITVENESLPMEDKLIFAKLDAPEEEQQIDNPVRVAGKVIAFEGSFIVRITDNEENIIHEEVLQASAGGPQWGEFDEEIQYPSPDGDEGSIEIGEYSAKDGEYILHLKVPVKF